MSPSQASVESLFIEVKAIRIDGRKMTIAVFKQLREIRLVCDPNSEKPTIRTDIKPWGYVRHTLINEGYLWLLLECQGVLCRAVLHPRGDIEPHRSPANRVLTAFCSDVLAKYDQLFIAT